MSSGSSIGWRTCAGRDADPGVRSRIATVLGECGTAAQLPTLWRRVQTTEEGRVQEKAWSGFIEIMARTGNRELFLEWGANPASQSNQAPRGRIQLLTELAGAAVRHEETACRSRYSRNHSSALISSKASAARVRRLARDAGQAHHRTRCRSTALLASRDRRELALATAIDRMFSAFVQDGVFTVCCSIVLPFLTEQCRWLSCFSNALLTEQGERRAALARRFVQSALYIRATYRARALL